MIAIRTALVERWGTAVGVGTFFFTGWFGIPAIISAGRCHSLSTRWDSMIPYLPQALPLYILGYVFPLTPLVLVRDHELFSHGAKIFLLLMGTCFAAFIAYPVCLEPPDLGLPSGAQQYFMAVSSNCFPSLHVASAWFVSLFFWDLRHPWRWGWAILALAVTLSTLLLKVHYVWDAAGGVTVGVVFHWVFMRRRTRCAGGR